MPRIPHRAHVREAPLSALARPNHTDSAPLDGTRLLVVSPVRDEAAHIAQVAEAVCAQTRRPDLWVIVDDNSTDSTRQEIAAFEDPAFMRVIEMPPHAAVNAKDRLAAGAPARAFVYGLEWAGWRDYTHVTKLDGDVVLPADYFERLLERFAADRKLAAAGGAILERRGTGWDVLATPLDQATAPARVYRSECVEEIGGVPVSRASDAIAGIYLRMGGYSTRTYLDLGFGHLRPSGTAQGALQGRVRHGEYAYELHQPFWWALLRAFRTSVWLPPRGLSGVAFLYGYVYGWARRAPRIDDPEFHRFMRRELRDRVTASARRRMRALVPGGT